MGTLDRRALDTKVVIEWLTREFQRDPSLYYAVDTLLKNWRQTLERHSGDAWYDTHCHHCGDPFVADDPDLHTCPSCRSPE